MMDVTARASLREFCERRARECADKVSEPGANAHRMAMYAGAHLAFKGLAEWAAQYPPEPPE